jgi:phosphoribosylformimino-5-aminoimidazole carboxamide ribotide isomerase
MTEIVPAIDLIGGKCVRLAQGDFAAQTDYADDPVDMAKAYAAAGAKRLHIVDLDGARAGKVMQLALATKMARASGLICDFGGGVRTIDAVENVLSDGMAQVNIGSAAIREPQLLRDAMRFFGPERIILTADARDGKVAAAGWKDQTELSLEDLIERFIGDGLQWVLTTDIARDGMLTGPATELYAGLKARFPKLGLIASGGVARIGDIVALDKIGVERAVIGKALLEGHIPLTELRNYAG